MNSKLFIMGSWFVCMGMFLCFALPIVLLGKALPARPKLLMIKGGKSE